MPTGYTAGILDGKITTFEQFAKTCIRAFGAAIHMRDDSLDVEYKKAEPSDYYVNNIIKYKEELESISKLSDDEIVKLETDRLLDDKKYHESKIVEANNLLEKLNTMLFEIHKWTPPTSEHIGFKEFMIEQIDRTIKGDASAEYHIEELESIKNKLLDLNPSKIRKEKIESAQISLNYAITEHNKEVARCNDANQWVDTLLKSINQ